jgi:hydrogenase maturation protease
MYDASDKAPILLFAYGNLSRGDDALGPMLLQRVEHVYQRRPCSWPLIFLQDYQLQIEHVMDMKGCEQVILMDASKSQIEPLRFYAVDEEDDITHHSTHIITPSQLLHIYQQVHDEPAPPTSMLAMQGYRFELGEGLSAMAENNLIRAEKFLLRLLQCPSTQEWDRLVASGPR